MWKKAVILSACLREKFCYNFAKILAEISLSIKSRKKHDVELVEGRSRLKLRQLLKGKFPQEGNPHYLARRSQSRERHRTLGGSRHSYSVLTLRHKKKAFHRRAFVPSFSLTKTPWLNLRSFVWQNGSLVKWARKVARRPLRPNANGGGFSFQFISGTYGARASFNPLNCRVQSKSEIFVDYGLMKFEPGGFARGGAGAPATTTGANTHVTSGRNLDLKTRHLP